MTAKTLMHVADIRDRLAAYDVAETDVLCAESAIAVLKTAAVRDRIQDEIGRLAVEDERFLLAQLDHQMKGGY